MLVEFNPCDGKLGCECPAYSHFHIHGFSFRAFPRTIPGCRRQREGEGCAGSLRWWEEPLPRSLMALTFRCRCYPLRKPVSPYRSRSPGSRISVAGLAHRRNHFFDLDNWGWSLSMSPKVSVTWHSRTRSSSCVPSAASCPVATAFSRFFACTLPDSLSSSMLRCLGLGDPRLLEGP